MDGVWGGGCRVRPGSTFGNRNRIPDFQNLNSVCIAGTGNSRLLSGSGLSGNGFFIPDSVSGRNRIKELTGIPAGILTNHYALQVKKIRACLVHFIGGKLVPQNLIGFKGQ